MQIQLPSGTCGDEARLSAFVGDSSSLRPYQALPFRGAGQDAGKTRSYLNGYSKDRIRPQARVCGHRKTFCLATSTHTLLKLRSHGEVSLISHHGVSWYVSGGFYRLPILIHFER